MTNKGSLEVDQGIIKLTVAFNLALIEVKGTFFMLQCTSFIE